MTKPWQGTVECSICGAKHKASIEIEDDQSEPVVPLECVECGNMTCYPEEKWDFEDYNQDDWTTS